MKQYLVGVDIGGTSIKIGLFDRDVTLQKKWSIPTNIEDNGSRILEEIASSIKETVSIEEVYGVGFGVPGPVFRDEVKQCVNLGWKGPFDLKSAFLDLIGRNDIIVHVSNDANTAALGEYTQGAAKGHTNVVMITIGTGIGGGIISHGHIIDGFDGVAGEIGHAKIDHTHNYACNCGKRGCLETVASATGIVRLAKDAILNSNEPSELRNLKSITAKQIIDLAKAKDGLAEAVVSEAAGYIARTFAFMTFTINPDIFVIGGGVSLAGTFLLQKIEENYYDYVSPFVEKTDFRLAELGNDSGIYGAASLVSK